MSTRLHDDFRIGETVMIDEFEHEVFDVVGINLPQRTLLLEGDWSAMYSVVQQDWYPMDKTFHTKHVKNLNPL